MGKKRILVVDDEQDLVESMRIGLEKNGYEVLGAYNGLEALNKAREEKPDLMILDLMLPKIDGHKVSAMLKRDIKYQKMPIIMLTARTGKSDEELAHKVGADMYITKPFQHEAILAKIKELLK